MDFIRAQLKKIPQINPVNLSNSTVLITGANGGLGLEAAREILQSKPRRLIFAVRDLEKGKLAASSLGQASLSSTNVEIRKLDQASFSSIQSFVKDLNGEPIHIAILNAALHIVHLDLQKLTPYFEKTGVWNTRFTPTTDHFESDLQVNALAPALLSLLLLPNLRKSMSTSSNIVPHLTFVTSGLHETAKFPESQASPRSSIITALNDPAKYNQTDRYPTTKTINMIWLRELARRVPSSEVVINGPQPGFCKTDLMRNASGVMGLLTTLFTALLARSASDGARCIVDAAMVKGPESHGTYLSEMEVKMESNLVRDASDNGLQGALWDEIVGVLNAQGLETFEVPSGK